MSHDEQPEPEGQGELYAALEALGGAPTWDELAQLLGFDQYRPALVRQARLLLGGDGAAAGQVVQASFAALREAWSRLGGPRAGACLAAPGDREQVTVRPAAPGRRWPRRVAA